MEITDELLENLGFEYSGDDGYSCDWFKGSFLIVQYGNDYIEDKTGINIKSKDQLHAVYWHVMGEKLTL